MSPEVPFHVLTLVLLQQLCNQKKGEETGKNRNKSSENRMFHGWSPKLKSHRCQNQTQPIAVRRCRGPSPSVPRCQQLLPAPENNAPTRTRPPARTHGSCSATRCSAHSACVWEICGAKMPQDRLEMEVASHRKAVGASFSLGCVLFKFE